MILLTTFASKNNLLFGDVFKSAVDKTLPTAILQGKIWLIDDTSEAVIQWLHDNHPEVFTTILRSRQLPVERNDLFNK